MKSLSDQIARDMREGTFPKKSETTQAEDRARVSYEAFRNGFDGGVLPPEWDKAPSWIRDAIHVAYLQGKVDSTGWLPMESAPKDGSWIIGLCHDRVSMIRVSWGHDRKGELYWCSTDSSYGDGIFCGWKRFDKVPPALV